MYKTILYPVFLFIFLSACQAQKIVKPDTSLTDTYWKVISLFGEGIKTQEGKKELSFTLSREKSSIKGFAGCNRFFGQYSSQNNALSFSPLATTRKMCRKEMPKEQQFLKVLSQVNYFKINSETLVLYDKNNNSIAEFIAVALN